MQTALKRVAIVTQATTPLGNACREALEAAGARVVALAAQADATLPAITRVVESATAAWGRVDIMVNLHVMHESMAAELMPLATFKQGIAVNLDAVFFGCQAAARQMMKQSPMGGCIINVISVGGVVALPGQAAFCAAMAGVNAITKTLATEWQPQGIRVIGVGAGLSEALARSLTLHPLLPDRERLTHRRIPLHTLTQPDAVAQAVTYLASDAARQVNGTTLYVDGGWLADGYWEG